MDKKSDNILTIIAHILVPGRRKWAIDQLIDRNLIDEFSANSIGKALSDNKYNYRNTGVRLSEVKLFLDEAIEYHEYCFLNPARTMSHLKRRLMAYPEASGKIHDGNIVDYGCGTLSSFNQAIILCANGARHVYAVEPGAIRWKMARHAAMETVKAIFARPADFRLSGLSDEEMRANISRIDFSSMYNEAEKSTDFGQITLCKSINEENIKKIDLIISTSVLEHVSHLSVEIGRQEEILAEDGIAIHAVDFTDHRHAHPEYEMFKFYYDGKMLDCNGLRFSEIVEVISKAGLSCRVAVKENIDADKIRRGEMVDRFSSKSDDDLTTRAATFLLSRPGGAG